MQFYERDEVTGAQVFMDTIHAEVHEGEMFSAMHSTASLANAGTARYVVLTDTKQPHLMFGIAAGGAMRATLSEAATYTGGTAVPSYNYNRLSTGTALMVVKHSPSAGTAGSAVLIDGMYLAGGASALTRVGASARTNVEYMLGTSQIYMLDVVNVSGSASVLTVTFEWYEEPAHAG